MRQIKPQTAAGCISDRHLEVRYSNEGNYEFRETGGQCGNFAVVEVGSINRQWVRSINDGHSAIARVSADGSSSGTLKLYTLSPSASDKWLEKVASKGTGADRKFLHGLLTYDYFAIVKTVRTKDRTWLTPKEWTTVPSPLLSSSSARLSRHRGRKDRGGCRLLMQT